MSYSCVRVDRGGVQENVYYKDGKYVNSGYLPKSKIKNLTCRDQKVIAAGPHNKKTSVPRPKSKSRQYGKGAEKTNQDEMPIPRRGKTPLPPPKPNKSSFKKYQKKKSSAKKSVTRKTPAKSKGIAQRKRALQREQSFRELDNRTKTKTRVQV